MARKIVLAVVCLFLFLGGSYAQQVPQFSQNMFNKLANNPGTAGSNQAICATMMHRSQWMGWDGAPTTLNLSVDAPLQMLHGGLGLNIMKDNIHYYDNLSLQVSYAYRTDLGDGQLGIGGSLGMFQAGLDGTQLNSATPNDPTIPTGEVSGSAMDFGCGLYYNTQDVYIGLSSLSITEPDIEYSDGTGTFDMVRHYFLLAGYYHEINPSVSLNPSIYLKSDGSTSQIDINTNILYNNRIWGGVSYRLDEGIILLTGMNINEDLKFGLAYDVVLNKMSNKQSGSLEFMLGYSFKIDYDKPIKSYKNPRYL